VHFELASDFELPQSDLFSYHAKPGALDRLIPPWENVTISQRPRSIEAGVEVLLRQRLGFFSLPWLARHTEYDPPHSFKDIQVYGPFKKWEHQHRFEELDCNRSKLTDSVDYSLKVVDRLPYTGCLGPAAHRWIQAKLTAMFRYRHRVTAQDLSFHRQLRTIVGTAPIRIAVSGSGGMIGRRLCALATVLGIEVVRILRPESKLSESELPLDSVILHPSHGFDHPERLVGVRSVVQLGGVGIASGRWNLRTKEKIFRSRVDGTKNLITHLLGLATPPERFVCASGIGFYGSRGEFCRDESSPKGEGFLSDVTKAWEESASQYQNESRRVAIGRLAMVLHPREGALAKQLPLFRMGLGGRVGDGKQYWSWIHVDDAATALIWLSLHPGISGHYNLASPNPVTNFEFTKTLARVLHRPAFLPAPAFALRTALGEMADELLLASTRTTPDKLVQTGFQFRAPTLSNALEQLLGKG
jgi:uncharacterized protein (TIGR01777 family)